MKTIRKSALKLCAIFCCVSFGQLFAAHLTDKEPEQLQPKTEMTPKEDQMTTLRSYLAEKEPGEENSFLACKKEPGSDLQSKVPFAGKKCKKRRRSTPSQGTFTSFASSVVKELEKCGKCGKKKK